MDTVDKATGELKQTPLERAKNRIKGLESDLGALQAVNLHMARQIQALKNELQQQSESAPEMRILKAIAKYYSARLGKSKGWKFGEKRRKAVKARLAEGFTAEFICRAIDGLAVGCYTNSDTGLKYNDLELVCRNEVNLEKYHIIAENNQAPSLMGPAWKKELAQEELHLGRLDDILKDEPLAIPEEIREAYVNMDTAESVQADREIT